MPKSKLPIPTISINNLNIMPMIHPSKSYIMLLSLLLNSNSVWNNPKNNPQTSNLPFLPLNSIPSKLHLLNSINQ